MRTTTYLQRHYSWILIFFILLGVVAGSFLVYQRHQVEKAQSQIENIVDYDAALRAASYEKVSTEESLAKLKKAGITAMAIYDRTLKKSADDGEIRIVRGFEANQLHFYGEGAAAEATYLLPVKGKEGHFNEIREDLYHRLGQDKVLVKQTLEGPVIELKQPYTSLVDMNLSISRIQAQDVVRHGFNLIVRPTNYKNLTQSDVDLVFKRIEGLPNVTGMVFVGKEVLGYPNQLEYLVTKLKANRIPLLGIETPTQLQYEPQEGFLPLANRLDYSVGRLYTIQKESLKKITPEEAAQWFYISDLERNIRFNLFPLYEAGIKNQTALETSISYIHSVTERLAARGFTFGRGSVYPDYKPSVISLMTTMIGAVALFSFMVNLFIPLRPRNQHLLFATLTFVTIIAYILTNGTLIAQIWALSSAISAPVVAITLLMECWRIRAAKVASTAPTGIVSAIGQAAIYVAGATFLAAIGGIYVAAILGNTRFFMEFALFRGVKLTFVMPVILTVIAYLQRFPLWKGNRLDSLADGKQFVREFLQVNIKLYMLVIFGFLAVVAWIFVGRSGHTEGVPVPKFELALRRFLEDTLYARPREKEFMIGHPALMLASFAVLRRWPMLLHFLFTVGGVIGIGSMVETFGHIRTPVLMSIVRGIDGLWIGIVLGVIAIFVFQFLLYTTAWYKKRQEVSHE